MQSNRKELIKEISEMRQSNVICYIGGDRQNVSTRIAPDIIPVFYKHLEKMEGRDKVDLFMFTKGGDVLTALRLVQLIYEYTDNFSVLIPFKAYSAGTLVALGASEIVMTKMGELSPVDPNVTSMFNPTDPNNPTVKLPISVEDVYSYFEAAGDAAKIESEEAFSEVFARFIDHVHPLAVGSVHRTYSLIRSVAKKLLLMHMDISQEPLIDEIVDCLTKRMHSHSYMITRKEARDMIKLPVTFSDHELEKKMWRLFERYKFDLALEKPFIPEMVANREGEFSVYCGLIESINRTDGYVFDGIVQRLNNMDPNSPSNVNIIDQGWRKI